MDGKYVATGCNRSAQIYDVETGEKLCILQDENIDLTGDLYIRSVCFSPDGKYLATGAEDKLIRVRAIVFNSLSSSLANVLDTGLGHPVENYSQHLPWPRTGHLQS